MTRIRKVLTFSNVIALIALFVALGGTVYAAGKINGKQIKASSLPGNRLKPKTITAGKIKAKTLTGNQVKKESLTGAQIKKGSLTATQINQTTLSGVSAASLAAVFYASTTVSVPNEPSGGGTTATATCPPGTFVIGGGANVSNDERSYVNDSGPTSLRTGWEATLYGQPGISMTVTAICTAVKAIG